MQEINLYDLIKFYVRKWRFIVILTVAGLAGGFVYNTFIQVTEYKSSAKLLLVSSQNTQTTTSQTLLNNYIDLIQSRRVLEPVVAKQNNSISYEQLTKAVSAVNQKDTAIIDVKVTTTNAKQSADIANEITDSFKEAVTTLYQTSGVIVVDPAVEPIDPSNVHKEYQLLISSGSGFVTSLVSLFFVYDYTGGKTNKVKAKKIVIKKNKKIIKKKSLLAKIYMLVLSKHIKKNTGMKESIKQAPKQSITKVRKNSPAPLRNRTTGKIVKTKV